MVLVVERDECSGQGAGSQLPAAPEQSPVLEAPPEQGVEPKLSAPPDQGVEPESPVGPDHCAELGVCDKPSGEASVWARRIQRPVYFVSEIL